MSRRRGEDESGCSLIKDLYNQGVCGLCVEVKDVPAFRSMEILLEKTRLPATATTPNWTHLYSPQDRGDGLPELSG